MIQPHWLLCLRAAVLEWLCRRMTVQAMGGCVMGERRGTVRKPATKFAHLRKKLEKGKLRPDKATKERQSSKYAGR